MQLRHVPLILAAAVLPAWAAAQPVSGVYFGGGAGINQWHDQSSGGVRIHDNDLGFVGIAALGYGFGNGLRLEAEGSFRGSDIDRISIGGARVGGGGTIRTYGGMGNVLFDFDLRSLGLPPYAVRPYLGGGLGYGYREIDRARATVGGTRFEIDDGSGSLAFQGIAGLAFGLEQVLPGLSATVEYRYFGTESQDANVSRAAASPVPPAGSAAAAVPGRLRLPNENHSVLIGLRYELFRPPVPVPVAAAATPAPAATRLATYVVFFDWDRADLTARSREIIGEAVVASRRATGLRIDVAGHADTSGSPSYNQRLSRRRADAVAAELVARGVARADIVVSAFGETRLLVPTADRVREPQNRRVEIVLR